MNGEKTMNKESENETQEQEDEGSGQSWQDDQKDILGEYYKQISRCDD